MNIITCDEYTLDQAGEAGQGVWNNHKYPVSIHITLAIQNGNWSASGIAARGRTRIVSLQSVVFVQVSLMLKICSETQLNDRNP